jgi:cob(I)alamin adenosyltransferase
MADDPTNIVLEHLRAMRGDMHEMKDMLREHGHRLTRIEISIASLRRDQASDAEGVAHLEARIDRLTNEVSRIKQRLDIID